MKCSCRFPGPDRQIDPVRDGERPTMYLRCRRLHPDCRRSRRRETFHFGEAKAMTLYQLVRAKEKGPRELPQRQTEPMEFGVWQIVYREENTGMKQWEVLGAVMQARSALPRGSQLSAVQRGI